MAERRGRKKPNRTPSSYVSRDPVKALAQRNNLRRGGGNGGKTVSHGRWAAIAQTDLDARTREVFEALSVDAPVRENDALPAADALIVAELARTLILRDRVVDYLNRRGLEHEDGGVRPVLGEVSKLNTHILSLAESLGMSPRSRVRIGVDIVRGMSAAEAFTAKLQGRGDG